MRVRRIRKFVKPRTGELVTFESKQYYVTDTGDVYDGDRHRYVSQREKFGYKNVALRDDNGKQHTTIRVHNLVATCFIRPLERGENVHHIDHSPKNNQLSNLEIIDASEHHRMHWKDGTMDGLAEKFSKLVAQIDMDGRLVKVWPSTQECGRNGYESGAVSCCCRNCFHRPGNNVYKGFRWQWYVKEKEI